MTYIPDNRPMFAQPFSSYSRSIDRCLAPLWADPDTAEGYLRGVLWNGFSPRVMLHIPAGKGDSNGQPPDQMDTGKSAQWWSMEKWRRDLLIDVCREYLAESNENTVEVYTTSRQWNPSSLPWTPEESRPEGGTPHGPHHDLDTRNPISMNWWLQTHIPWIVEVGVHRIWLDASALPDRMWGAYRAAKWMSTEYGIPVGMEAVPLIRNRDNTVQGVNERFWYHMPYLCASQYLPQRGDFAAWCPVPEGREGVIVCTGHTPDLTAEQLDAWREMGWSVGSMHRSHDDLVFGE